MRLKNVGKKLRQALKRIDVDEKTSLPEYKNHVKKMRALFKDNKMFDNNEK
tara:strand:+ start:21922 stop:22074 length:153 start_codon:yes stop_codon:yes gene_type:complete